MPTSTSEAATGIGKEDIRAHARSLGFDAVAFTDADLDASAGAGLDAYLRSGAHGDMDWLDRRSAERRSPKSLWPEARSVIAVAANYGPIEDPLDVLQRPDVGAISVYARGEDYHDVLKKRLKALGRWVADNLDCAVKVFVDTAPVLEKPIAAKAGLGWQGKHTNLVSRDYGSWLFLGEVFVAAELEPDAPHADRCGRCSRCLDVCPTRAFPAPYKLDARRCISYLTIEHKGHIPRAFRAAMGNRIYGCDDCLAVCPWNRFAKASHDARLAAREDLNAPPLADLAALDDAGFRALFRKSPIKRLGRDRFVRNVLIAIGNSGKASLDQTARDLLQDVSPLVRAMAVWAHAQLAPVEVFLRDRDRLEAEERDDTVRIEWREGAFQ